MRGKLKIEWREGILVGILVLSAIFLATRVYDLALKARVAWQRSHEAQVQYASLENRQKKLQADLNQLNTPRGQDAAIRDAFGVARPGEEVIVVVPPATSTASSTSWWDGFLNLF